VADLGELLVLLIGEEAPDRLAVGKSKQDDAVGLEIPFVHPRLAHTSQVLPAMASDELADMLTVGSEGRGIMDVEVDDEECAHPRRRVPRGRSAMSPRVMRRTRSPVPRPPRRQH